MHLFALVVFGKIAFTFQTIFANIPIIQSTCILPRSITLGLLISWGLLWRIPATRRLRNKRFSIFLPFLFRHFVVSISAIFALKAAAHAEICLKVDAFQFLTFRIALSLAFAFALLPVLIALGSGALAGVSFISGPAALFFGFLRAIGTSMSFRTTLITFSFGLDLGLGALDPGN